MCQHEALFLQVRQGMAGNSEWNPKKISLKRIVPNIHTNTHTISCAHTHIQPDVLWWGCLLVVFRACARELTWSCARKAAAYVPSNADFKKEIGTLMDKEYIERDTAHEGAPAYVYVA